MSTIQWWLQELGVEVNVGSVVVVVVEVAFVLLEKHVQEMKEEERLRWLFFFEEMENLRFIVGVWRWVLSGNICVVEIVGEGERSSSMTCSYGFISWQTMSISSQFNYAICYYLLSWSFSYFRVRILSVKR